MESVATHHGAIDRLVEESAKTRLDGRKQFRLNWKERQRVATGWNPSYLEEYDQGLQRTPQNKGATYGWFVYANWSDIGKGSVIRDRRRWAFGSETQARAWAARLPEGARAEVCQRRVDCLIDLSGKGKTKPAGRGRGVGGKEKGGRVKNVSFDTSGVDFI